MKTQCFEPIKPLKPYISTYLIKENHVELLNRVLPNRSFALAFRLKGQISYFIDGIKSELPPITITGLRKSPRLINYSADSKALIVLFKEMGFSAFTKFPTNELFGLSISLNDVFPNSELSVVEENLTYAETNFEKIKVVEKYLLSKLIHHKQDALVKETISKIYAGKGMISIKKLMQALPISQDAFEKRFRKATGATPKQFSFIVRMNSLVHQNLPETNFLDMVYDMGFYDQSHFIKNFKLFTGQTPSDFYKSPIFW